MQSNHIFCNSLQENLVFFLEKLFPGELKIPIHWVLNLLLGNLSSV
jgi:hypothetical protein